MSATGLKIWRIGSAVMWAGLAIWLFASRDEEGRLNEWYWAGDFHGSSYEVFV
jgi:hypothetical protein